MSKMAIRKPKRAGVLTNKRAQILRKHKQKSYRPLYEKLKHNNSHLAKALSKEKQNSKALFTQNIELVEEIQQLNLICNTRNTVISNVLNNAKEILKMLVTMTGYMTNTISMCQELVATNTAVRLSAAGRKESPARLSTKSPTKGVVKPMVGGHTITKPTINLSRVNMESINISRLSDIQEVTTPTRSPEITENRSPIISLPSTPLRYENGRTCRLPERLTISSPSVNADEQRLRRKRKRHSKRLSVSFSRSRNRWSTETPTTTEHINVIDTRINIENQENHDEISNDHLTDRINAIPESQVSINLNEENETHINTSKKDSDVQINNKTSNKAFSKNSNSTKSFNLQNNTRSWEEEDPLEGPSWLLNNTISPRESNEPELEHVNVSDVNNNTSQIIVYDDSSVTENNLEDISNLNESMNGMQTSERDPLINRSECNSYVHEHNTDNSICGILPTATMSNSERTLDNVENSNADDAMKFTSFVTVRRGHSEAPEETEDFTLMLRQSAQNMQFNINELRYPVLEESMINNSTVNNEIDTEVTAAIPRLTISDHKRTPTPQKTKHSNKSKKLPNMKDATNHTENSSIIKNKAKSRNKSENNRDPSAAKVVLEKLNETHVKPRTSINDTQNANVISDFIFDEDDNQRDSESSTYTSSRPRRRKAPINLKEPKLNKKLRRD